MAIKTSMRPVARKIAEAVAVYASSQGRTTRAITPLQVPGTSGRVRSGWLSEPTARSTNVSGMRGFSRTLRKTFADQPWIIDEYRSGGRECTEHLG